MRCYLPFLLAGLAFATPAGAAVRNFGIAGFDRVRVDGPFKVKLTTGVPSFARARGDSRARDRVSIVLQGNTLVVKPERASWGGWPGETDGPVEIELGTHDLSSAWVNGAGSLDISAVKGLSFDLSMQGSGLAGIGQADVDQLRITVLGTGTARVAGKAGKLTALVRGVSNLDASALTAKDARIAAEGPATVKAQVLGDAIVNGTGAASVELAGSPSCTQKLFGSATVSGCK